MNSVGQETSQNKYISILINQNMQISKNYAIILDYAIFEISRAVVGYKTLQIRQTRWGSDASR
jgi:hypothetical protein